MKRIDSIKLNDPLYEAIDLGGGQTCDVERVFIEINKAGFAIFELEPSHQRILADGNTAYSGEEIEQRLNEAGFKIVKIEPGELRNLLASPALPLL